ncbi:MAG: leucine--tRNA ligase [Candidatus Kerfeldbacteria bacterium]
MKKYNHKAIEKKWQKYWEDNKIWQADDKGSGEKYYILDMFPYPSAEGLHVGHPEGYTASDIVTRYQRMNGKNVLHPMGFDSFGLPAENYAIKTGTHPVKTTAKNINNMRKQIKSLGFSYDWDREVITSDPSYYKWTQWIFIQLFKHGLAYEADAPINWCPSCKTGLANEEVVNGKCERCGSEVTKKQIKQWLVKITDDKYIERLEKDLDDLDWPESIKHLQRNWIGRSEGAEVDFRVIASDSEAISLNSNKDAEIAMSSSTPRNDIIKVFTTRPDTLFGATYMVLSPEHELVNKITTDKQQKDVHNYQIKASGKSDLERTDLAKDKTGVFTGAYAINSVNKEKIPIWIADYVLSSYGTGAIMAVPAHDERDHEFAKKFKLPIVEVIKPSRVMPKTHPPMGSAAAWGIQDSDLEYTCWIGDGEMINSGKYDSMNSVDFKKEITTWLEQKKVGKKAVNYKLRDWLFSRQRYWGEPIPIVHCDDCKNRIESGATEIHFYNQSFWDDILNGKKTVETRALNPDEPERYFGDIKAGQYLKLKNMTTGAIQYAEVMADKIYSDIDKFYSDKKMFVGMGTGNTYKSGEDLLQAYAFTSDYIERIKKNGLVAWKIKLVSPGNVAVLEKDLPLELPDIKKYEPTGTGESPLATIDKWVNTKCPECGGKAKRETNTMPQWAGSNWYFLRYCDPKNDKMLADPEKLKKWLPVDLYIGGAEHAVLHLLYARFIYKFLFDIGVVPKEIGDEPFAKLKNQGLIMGEDGVKMSKSRGNVINPDDVIKEYGADTLRMYEMFMGPFEDSKPWDTKGIVGIKRFLDRVYNAHTNVVDRDLEKAEDRLLHTLIKFVTNDIEDFKFNTCVSHFMGHSNYWSSDKSLSFKEYEIFLIILSPFAPHMCEELWEDLGHKKSISKESWPEFSEEIIKREKVTIVVQVNGKVRDNITVSRGADEEDVILEACASIKVQKYIPTEKKNGKIIFKGKGKHFVKDRIINFVV